MFLSGRRFGIVCLRLRPETGPTLIPGKLREASPCEQSNLEGHVLVVSQVGVPVPANLCNLTEIPRERLSTGGFQVALQTSIHSFQVNYPFLHLLMAS